MRFSAELLWAVLEDNLPPGTTGLLVGSQDVTPMGLARHAVTLEDDADEPLGGLMRRVLKTMKV